MKVQFANGKEYEVKDVDEAIAKCLADGNDPFNPVVVQDTTDKKTIKNADTVEQ
jgi:uncharacterized protein (UPF0179 family)